MTDNDIRIVDAQRRQLCAVHAINNLLQLSSADPDVATKEELDEIADSLTLVEKQLSSSSSSGTLSWYDRVRSNHSMPVLGNYSYEVLEAALMKRGVHLHWWPCSNLGNNLVGYVINVGSTSILNTMTMGLFGGRHWYAIVPNKNLGWVELDSKKVDSRSAPLAIQDVNAYLQEVAAIDGNLVFACVMTQ